MTAIVDTRTPDPKKFIKGATGDWEIIIGLEIHAQVTSQAKLFSGASASYGGEPNAHVSLVDAAMPGMLPVINEECVKQAIRSGLGLNAQINLRSVFDRKNYFYPDLPKGYQITQHTTPICFEGFLDIKMGEEKKRIGMLSKGYKQRVGIAQAMLHNPDVLILDEPTSGLDPNQVVEIRELIREAGRNKTVVLSTHIMQEVEAMCDKVIILRQGNLVANDTRPRIVETGTLAG